MKKLIICLFAMSTGLAKAQLADSTRRLVHVKGAVNFRDVGGYKTKEGSEVKWGKVFRSADISQLTDADLDTMKSRRIATVVDFRGTKEAALAPDKLPVGTEYIHCPAGSENIPSGAEMVNLLKKGNFLEDFYGQPSVQYAGARFKPLFQKLLATPDSSAVLYHCTGGRDRTGMGTALFLYALGVPLAKIEEDFVASNTYLQLSNTKMLNGLAAASGLSIEEISKQMALRPELLKTFFSALTERYGSVEKFMESELGIGKKEIKQLKLKYTTKS